MDASSAIAMPAMAADHGASSAARTETLPVNEVICKDAIG
jgi:hypothetical protein